MPPASVKDSIPASPFSAMRSANQAEHRGPRPLDEPDPPQPLRPETHGTILQSIIGPGIGVHVLTAIESNLLDPSSLTEMVERTSVVVEALRSQIQTALDGATFKVGPSHIHQQQVRI